MIAILPAPPIVYHRKYRHSNANNNASNLDHVVVEYNIDPIVNGEYDISCRL